MTKTELEHIVAQLRIAGSDLTHVEAKAARNELPKRIWETISAFSNTTGGGTLILGLAESENFAVKGVSNPRKIQQDLASACSEMEPAVRAYIQVEQIHGRTLVVAQIPEMPPASKPCYHPGAGLTNGAFIRVADGDRKLSHYEVQMLLAARGQPRDDEEPVPATSISDLQPRLVKVLLSRIRRRPGTPFAKASDESILKNTKVLVSSNKRWVCSLGGLLALGKYPQQFLPGLALTFVAYPGTEVGVPGPNQERFLDNVRVEGSIPAMLQPTFNALRRNMKRRSIVQGLFRQDIEEYPITALREAIINAVAHRDLSNGSRGTPVQIQMFANRLSVLNPGGLFGPVTIELLGREGISSARNSTLLRILEDVTPPGERRAVCENRGSGLGAMIASLTQAGLQKPAFENRISSFRVTFFNEVSPTEEDQSSGNRRSRRDEILTVILDRGEMSRAEISQQVGLSDGAARKWLAILRQEGLISITDPARPRSKNIRYRIVTPKLIG